jgi:sulfotransferase
VPVRNLSDVLASFEKLHRKAVARNSGGRPPGETAQNYFQMQTVVGRCEWWMREDQPVGLAYVRICDALARGLRDRLHLVVAEELTRRPAEVMQGIYDFLGEKPFMHDFEHVEQVTREDDGAHGHEDLHTIRPKVEPIESTWRQVLGPIGEKWARAHQGLW